MVDEEGPGRKELPLGLQSTLLGSAGFHALIGGWDRAVELALTRGSRLRIHSSSGEGEFTLLSESIYTALIKSRREKGEGEPKMMEREAEGVWPGLYAFRGRLTFMCQCGERAGREWPLPS